MGFARKIKKFFVSYVTIGSDTEPSYGGALLRLSGQSSASDRNKGPDILAYVSDSDYPCYHIQPYQFNNISTWFGGYNSGSQGISGKAGSGARLWYSGVSDFLAIRTFSGQTEGQSISSFNDSMQWQLSTGNVTAKNNLTVEGDLSVNTVEGISISDAQFGYLGNLDQDLATTDNVTFNQITGTLQTATQTNITSVGTLTSLNLSGVLAIESTDGELIKLTSGNASNQCNIGIGRVETEGRFAVASSFGQFFVDAPAGAICIRHDDDTKNIMLGCGTGNSTISITDQKVGINTQPLNALDVAGAIAVGLGPAGVETAPTNGIVCKGDFKFYGTGTHGLYFPDENSGISGRSGILQRTDDFYIYNNSSNHDMRFYNGAADIIYTGWNGEHQNICTKIRTNKGSNILGVPTSSVSDDDFIWNTKTYGSSGTAAYGSVVFQEVGASSIKLKICRSTANKTVTNVTQANPAVVTSSGHGFSNGDKVGFTAVDGMIELNDNIYTVANATTNTFELSGVDSTGYTAYTANGRVDKLEYDTITLTYD